MFAEAGLHGGKKQPVHQPTLSECAARPDEDDRSGFVLGVYTIYRIYRFTGLQACSIVCFIIGLIFA